MLMCSLSSHAVVSFTEMLSHFKILSHLRAVFSEFKIMNHLMSELKIKLLKFFIMSLQDLKLNIIF